VIDRNELIWWKSSKSASGACVEVATGGGSAHMRDSHDPDGPVLTFPIDVFRDFIADVKTASG
jgi:hypothetical protein